MAAIDARVSDSPLSLAQCQTACRTGQEPAANNQWRALVAQSEATVSGFIAYTRVLDEASILAVAVDEQCQGCGIGRALLVRALLDMHSAGAVRCLLEVRASNEAAQQLYRSQGFQIDGLRKNYYSMPDGREDAVLMTKHLSQP